VSKPVVEPMLLRLAACGSRRWSGGEPYCCLRFCMNAINLFSKSMVTFSSKCFLVPITLLVAGRVF
jgi:hypothetical protein